MSHVLRITSQLYRRLETHAKGFDTPANVIERLLDYYEQQENIESTQAMEPDYSAPGELKILLYPEDESEFKALLLADKKAHVRLYRTDDSHETKEWSASRFSETSNLMGNLRSGPLRGWKSKGIYKAAIAINKDDL
jgi:hypothetical protein